MSWDGEDEQACPCPICRAWSWVRRVYWPIHRKIQAAFTHRCMWKAVGKRQWIFYPPAAGEVEFETFLYTKCGKIHVPDLDDVPFHPNHRGCIVPTVRDR